METYHPDKTAILLIDPYNDFLSEGGLLHDKIAPVANEVNAIENIKNLMKIARSKGIQIFIVPHKRWEPNDYKNWKHPNPTQIAISERHTFEKGKWGGEWHPDLAPQETDIVIKEHWAQNGFANTDLDLMLKQHSISYTILVGLLANTCVEATARYAMELGYHVTLVKDATATYTQEMMHAAHELNGPTFAHQITSTQALIDALNL